MCLAGSSSALHDEGAGDKIISRIMDDKNQHAKEENHGSSGND